MNAALVRYVASDAARSQRWIAPFVLFVAACAIINSGAGPLLTTYADTIGCLFAFTIWIAWVVVNSEDPVNASITAVTIGGPTRLRAAKLATACLACGVVAILATALPLVFGDHSDRVTLGHIAAGAIGHLLAAGAGVAIGSLLQQSVIRRAGWAFLVGASGFLVELVVPNFPPIRQLLVLFNQDHPAHLAGSLLATTAETAVVCAVVIALSLRIARARS